MELLDIVDRRDNVLDFASRTEVCKRGLLHRAVNIVVFNKKKQLFLQRRSKKKSAFGLYWDISASEHVKKGESYESAAVRGLKEELSINASVELFRSKHFQKSEYEKSGQLIVENEIVELYVAIFSGRIAIDKEEVEEGKFVSIYDLGELTRDKNANFTPWGLEELNYLAKKTKRVEKFLR